MSTTGKPWWQQVTAMVTLTASGAVTGFSFVPGTAAELSSPTGVPVHLMALEHAARPSANDDAALRTAIVNVSHYFLRLAKGKTPAQMQALIWQKESPDGTDHGATCAAFASLTLEMAAQAVGRSSWVTGGSTYPYPLYDWADVRVEPNPESPRVISVLQDARAHHRWHPLGDGYQPLPGDWVLFHGHMEVITSDDGGLLRTIGGSSAPNLSVNAHEFPAPLASHGVIGFVNNGSLPPSAAADPGVTSARDQNRAPSSEGSATHAADGGSSVPGFQVLSDTGRADPGPGNADRATPAFAPDPAKRGSSHARSSAGLTAIPDLAPASPAGPVAPAAGQTHSTPPSATATPAAAPRRQHEPASSDQTQNQHDQPGAAAARPASSAQPATTTTAAARTGEAAAIPGAQAPLTPADAPGQAQLAFGEIAGLPARHVAEKARHHAQASPAHTASSQSTASQPTTVDLTQTQPGSGQAAMPGQATPASQPANPSPAAAGPGTASPNGETQAPPAVPASPPDRSTVAGQPANGSLPATHPLTTGPDHGAVAEPTVQPSAPRQPASADHPANTTRPATSPNGTSPHVEPTAPPAHPSHGSSSKLISVTTDPPVSTDAPAASGPDHQSPATPGTTNGLHQRGGISSTTGSSGIGDSTTGDQSGPQQSSQIDGTGTPAVQPSATPSPAGSSDPVRVTTDPPLSSPAAAEPAHQSQTAPDASIGQTPQRTVPGTADLPGVSDPTTADRSGQPAGPQQNSHVDGTGTLTAHPSATPSPAGSDDPIRVTTDPPVHLDAPAAAKPGHQSLASPAAPSSHSQHRAVPGAAELPGFSDPATVGSAGQQSQTSGGGTVSGHGSPAGADVTGRPGALPSVPHRQHASGHVGLASFREPGQRKATGGLANVPGAISASAPVQASPEGSATGHGAVRDRTSRPSSRAVAGNGGPAAKRHGTVQIPGVPVLADTPGAQAGTGGHKAGALADLPGLRYQRHRPATIPVPEPPADASASQQAFIASIAPGAVAAQSRYGVPAAVTIAQAINESGWGESSLASRDHNLFGIKGTGPAGTTHLPTTEYVNGSPVGQVASFRVYHSFAESIDDHGRLLSSSGYYTRAMAARHNPDAFAHALTGVYATDPSYGSTLVSLMQRYNLYRYDIGAPGGAGHTSGAPARGSRTSPGPAQSGSPTPVHSPAPVHSPTPVHSPNPPSSPSPTSSPTAPSPAPSDPAPGPSQAPSPASPAPTSTSSPAPAPSGPAPTTSPTLPPSPAPTAPAASPATSDSTPPTSAVPSSSGQPRTDATAPDTAQPGQPAARRASAQVPAQPNHATQGDQERRLPKPAPSLPVAPAPIIPGVPPTPPAQAYSSSAVRLTPRHPHLTAARRAVAGRRPPVARHLPRTEPTGNATRHTTSAQLMSDSATRLPSAPAAGEAAVATAAANEASPSPRQVPGPAPRRATSPRQADPAAAHGPQAPADAPAPRRTTTPRQADPVAEHEPHAPADIPAWASAGSRAPWQAAARLASTPPGRPPDQPAITPSGSPSEQHSPPARTLAGSRKPSASRPSATDPPAARGTGPQSARQPGAVRQPRASRPAATENRSTAVPRASDARRPAPAQNGTPRSRSAAERTMAAQAQPRQQGTRQAARATSQNRTPGVRYQHRMPPAVLHTFLTTARVPLLRSEPLYRDVADGHGIRWELLAACDWLQCRARPRYSPVHGEKLGTLNADGTCYRTRSEALDQCAFDLVELARTVYWIDLTAHRPLSVRDLANTFAAFRWGGLLRLHHTSAMEFPYSVAGLTEDHLSMRWPSIAEPHAPDRPGSRFRQPFGAVPILLGLSYPATA